MLALRTSAPHLRPLLQYVAFGCRDFPLMCDRLSILMNGLDSLHKTKALTYPVIRGHVLKADAPEPSYIYWPPMAWDISIGDVGYIKDTSFIKILNMRDHFEFTVVSPSIDYLSVSGSFERADLGEGVIRCVPCQHMPEVLWIHVSPRYLFKAPLYVELGRFSDPQEAEEEKKFCRYFISEAPKILEEYGVEHNILLSDLILSQSFITASASGS